jgi:hypothetical protein
MLDIRFYGKLRRFADDASPTAISRRQFEPDGDITVQGLLERLGVDPVEVGHIFLNNRLLLTCATMNLWLNYPDARERVPAGGTPWETVLHSGDRVALFGQDMGLLVV